MGQTSITIPMDDVNVKADVSYQKVKEGSLFPKNRIVHRTPSGKRCVQVNSTVLEGSGKRILFHSTEKVYIDEDGQMIPSADVVDWLVEDDGTESQVNKFEQNMKKGVGVVVNTRVPRDLLRGFVIGDIYEIITEDENQKWNLWKLAKDLWDKNEVGIIKEVVLSSGYTVRAGILVPYVDEKEGYFYVELQLTTKKREPNGMKIPTVQPLPGPKPKADDKKQEHIEDILANPAQKNIIIYDPEGHFATSGKVIFHQSGKIEIVDAPGVLGKDQDETEDIYMNIESSIEAGNNEYEGWTWEIKDERNLNPPHMTFTLEKPDPWVDGTWVIPGEYPVVNFDEGSATILADTYDDREGKLLHARNQEVTVITKPELYEEEVYEGIYVGEPNPPKIEWIDVDVVEGNTPLPPKRRFNNIEDAQSYLYSKAIEDFGSIINPEGWYNKADIYVKVRGEEPKRFRYDIGSDKSLYSIFGMRKNPGVPTKEFWNKLYPKILKRYAKEYGKKKAEEIARRVVGDIWYHKMKPKTRDRFETIRKIRESRANPSEAVQFECPECGKMVRYEANVVPASWDEPGYIEDEWIDMRNCDSTCPMTEEELIEYAKNLDNGDWFDPSEPDPDELYERMREKEME